MGEIGIFEVVEVVKVQQWLLSMLDIKNVKEEIILKLLVDINQSNTVYGLKTDVVKNLEKIVHYMIRF